MKKIKLEHKNPKNIIVDFKDVSIEIKPFLSVLEQVALINDYLNTYFRLNEIASTNLIPISKYNYLESEYNLILSIINILTNIDVNDFDYDLLESSNIKQVILSNIINYPEFKEKLDYAVESMKHQKEQELSSGIILQDFFSKVMEFFSKINSVDSSQLETLQNNALSILEKINSNKEV